MDKLKEIFQDETLIVVIEDEKDREEAKEIVSKICSFFGIEPQELVDLSENITFEDFEKLISDIEGEPEKIAMKVKGILSSVDEVLKAISTEEADEGDPKGTPEDRAKDPETDTHEASGDLDADNTQTDEGKDQPNDAPEEKGDEGSEEQEENEPEDKDEPKADGQTEGATEPEAKDDDVEIENAVKIVKPTERVSTKPWSLVNKISLRNKLMKLLEDNEPGAKEALYEIYGLVRCEDKMTCWKFPHHELIKNEVVLNINGLRAAALAALGARRKPKVTKEELKKIAVHLVNHYEAIDKEPPERLRRIAVGEAGSLDVDINVDSLEELGIDPDKALGLIAMGLDIIEDLVEEGVIEIEGALTIKDAKELKAFLFAVEQFVDNSVKALTEGVLPEDEKDLPGLEKLEEEIKKLSARNKELEEELNASKEDLEKLHGELEAAKKLLDEAEQKISDYELLKAKFNLLAEELGETNPALVEAVLEASEEKELKFVRKLRTQIGQNRIQKKSIIKSLGLLEGDLEDSLESNDNETVEEDIEKEVNFIVDFLN